MKNNDSGDDRVQLKPAVKGVFPDHIVIAKFIPVNNTPDVAVLGRYLPDGSGSVWAQVQGGNLAIKDFMSGVGSSAQTAYAPTAGQAFWVRLIIRDNTAIAEVWNENPLTAPNTDVPVATTSLDLGGNSEKFGTCGVRMNGTNGDQLDELWWYGMNHAQAGPKGDTGPVGLAMPPTRAYRQAAGPACGAGVWTKIPLDHVDFDDAGHWDVVNGNYVVPADGVYHVDVACWMNPGGGAVTGLSIGIFKNGIQHTFGQSISSAWGASCGDDIKCVAGDTIDMRVYNGNATGSVNPNVSVPSQANYMTVNPVGLTVSPLGTGARAASAYKNAAGNATNGAWAQVPLDTRRGDPSGLMDITTQHCYVCPAAGDYDVRGQVSVSATGANQQANVAIYKNGAPVSFGDMPVSTASGQVIRAVVSDILIGCAAGDLIQLFVWVNAALAYSISSVSNWLTVKQIG